MHEENLSQIPWMRPCFSGKEKEYLIDALDSTWISGGKYIEKLENKMKDYIKTPYAISCANGTAALHLAFLALSIGEGDEVILPGFGFMAAANVLLHLKSIPVFVDIDEKTWCMSASAIKKSITSSTKAIVVIHPLGNLCDMDAMLQISRQYDVPIIEDAAEGFPSTYIDHVAGSMGLIGTYSFQATKTIATGEGGLIAVQSREIAEKIKLYKSHGMLRQKHYWHELPGLNYRLTNIQAAMGCAQFEHLTVIIQKRHQMYKWYLDFLSNVKGIQLQAITNHVAAVVWAVGVLLDHKYYPQGRDCVIEQMARVGIETRPGFYTPHSFDYFDAKPLPISDYVSSHVILLPSWPDLTQTQIKFISKSLISLRAPHSNV